MSEGGSCNETTGKKVIITLQRAMTKKGSQFLKEKISDTVSCRPGDTNLSDGIDNNNDDNDIQISVMPSGHNFRIGGT